MLWLERWPSACPATTCRWRRMHPCTSCWPSSISRVRARGREGIATCSTYLRNFRGRSWWRCVGRGGAGGFDERQLRIRLCSLVAAPTGAGERVLYSSFIVKINSRSKAQERVLVITDQAVYNVLPSDYSKCKRRIEFELLESVTMSQISEEFVLHVPSQYDYRLHSLRKKEIVECLKRAYQGALRADLPVHLTTEAKLNDICVKKRMSKKQRDILQVRAAPHTRTQLASTRCSRPRVARADGA